MACRGVTQLLALRGLRWQSRIPPFCPVVLFVSMKQQSGPRGQTVTGTSSPSRVPQGPPRRHLAVPGGRSRGAGHRPQAALPSVAGKRLGGCFAQAPGRSAQALSTVSRARPEGAALAGQAGPGLSQGACVAGLLASTQLGALRPEFSAPAPGPCGPRGLSTFLTGMPHKATGPHRSGGSNSCLCPSGMCAL